MIAAILFELTLPLTPAQVLWINMVTSSTLGLALAFEPAERDIMARSPRPPGEPLLSGFFVWRVVMVSILMMTGALGLFLWELEAGTDVDTARTMAVNAIVAAEMFYLINSRYIIAPVFNREGLLGNRYALLAIAACIPLQIAFTHTSVMQNIFGSADLSALEWLKVIGAGLLVFILAELEKSVMRRTSLIGYASPLGHGNTPDPLRSGGGYEIVVPEHKKSGPDAVPETAAVRPSLRADNDIGGMSVKVTHSPRRS